MLIKQATAKEVIFCINFLIRRVVKFRGKKVKRIIIWNGFSISLPNGDFGTATLAIDDIRFLSSFCLLQLCRSLAKRGLLTTANSNRHIARTGMQLGLRVRFYPIVVTSSYQKTTVPNLLDSLFSERFFRLEKQVLPPSMYRS